MRRIVRLCKGKEVFKQKDNLGEHLGNYAFLRNRKSVNLPFGGNTNGPVKVNRKAKEYRI